MAYGLAAIAAARHNLRRTNSRSGETGAAAAFRFSYGFARRLAKTCDAIAGQKTFAPAANRFIGRSAISRSGGRGTRTSESGDTGNLNAYSCRVEDRAADSYAGIVIATHCYCRFLSLVVLCRLLLTTATADD